jgi:hypothetical protein
MANQKVQTLTNEQMINHEIDDAIQSYKQQRKETFESATYSNNFPKPVMVYDNPNFKPHRTETKILRQAPAPKRHIISPGYIAGPGLFLNRDTGSSFPDRERQGYYDPETGNQYGGQVRAASGLGKSRSAKNFSQPNGLGRKDKRMVADTQHQNPIPPQQMDMYSMIDKAKSILKNNGSQNRFVHQSRGHRVDDAMGTAHNISKEPSFNQNFKAFYETEIKVDPQDLNAALRLVEIEKKKKEIANSLAKNLPLPAGLALSQLAETQSTKQASPAQPTSPNNPLFGTELPDQKRNPRSLYKITTSKPQKTLLIHQPHPSKYRAMQGYEMAHSDLYKEGGKVRRLDQHVALDKMVIPHKDRVTQGMLHEQPLPSWEEIRQGQADLDTVYAYVEEEKETLGRGMPVADPVDIDDDVNGNEQGGNGKAK